MSDQQAVATPSEIIAEIESMDYQQMLTTWMTGASYLVEGSEEKRVFDARFQKLRAELQPSESASTNSDRKRNKKKGGYRGRR